MYRNIYVAVDNSPLSDAYCAAAVSQAEAFGASVVGSHVYAARLHERRFRQLESKLPEEYQEDRELERQRAIHDSFIALGLKLISDCYLDSLEQRCQRAEIPFERKTLDGKNWERLVEDINASDCDMVVMGARGHGSTQIDSVGSVCMRVLRRTRTDTLVVKDPEAFRNGAGHGILVALDGSQEAFGALQAALAIGKAYDRPVSAVATYDPYFHYAVFQSMVEVLSVEAAGVFRFKEQERLHEEIIDTGLARLYQTHLDVAQRMAAAMDADLTTTLLAGRAADELLAFAQETDPWLLLLGRIGVHSREEMDIGSVTEHLVRYAPCNLFVASRRFSMPLDLWGASTLHWTDEAEGILERVPQEYRGAIRLLVHGMALEQGHTVVNAALARDALAVMRPSRDQMRGMGEAALSVAKEALRRESGTVYLCPKCGHASRSQRPVACPVCRQEGEEFLAVETDALEAAAHAQGGVKEGQAFDGVATRWSQAALNAIQQVEGSHERSHTRLRIEKAARLAKAAVITLEFAMRHMRAGSQQNGPD